MARSTKAAPIDAAITINQLPPMPSERMVKAVVALPAANITAATPKLAPAVMPNTEGPANGFLKRVCICRPPTDKAAPTNTAVMVLGNLIFNTIACQASLSTAPPTSILATSAMGIRTDPRPKSSSIKTTTARIRMTNNLHLFEPWLERFNMV